MRLFASSAILLLRSTRSMSTFSSYSRYLSPHSAGAAADIYMLPMFDDNYGYVVVDKASRQGFAVDIGDARTSVIQYIRDMQRDGMTLKLLLCTHKHGDHVGGNADMIAAFPDISIVGTSYESIPFVSREVKDGDELIVGSLSIKTLFTPCHTSGHVSYFVESGSGGAPMLFCGDTLFVGGCGRFFEGTPAQMLANMRRLGMLPSDTLVCCAHEYTLGNFKFLSHLDSSNEVVTKRFADVMDLRDRNPPVPTVPSTIAEELRSNLFMQCDQPRVQRLVGSDSAEDCMGKLREMKNNFR